MVSWILIKLYIHNLIKILNMRYVNVWMNDKVQFQSGDIMQSKHSPEICGTQKAYTSLQAYRLIPPALLSGFFKWKRPLSR